jgi:outer membrane protein assembly factor BamB
MEYRSRPTGPRFHPWSCGGAPSGPGIYTQEQRGEDEVISSHDATTGEPLWKHRVAARFWESQAGAGPRATPTLDEGRLYALGATGILNALDAETGSILWTRNVGDDAGEAVPIWGFSGSPLMLRELVVVAASGTLVAYDAATGEPRWHGPKGDGESYASPHRVTLDGVEQILLARADGLIAVDPDNGTALWEHTWPGFRIVQPAVLPDGDLLLASEKNGVRRLRVNSGLHGWTVEERWTSTRLKPYFGDFVIHGGHVFGFDGGILACIDLENGERMWKGGRYGHGQLLLLPELDLLLVLSEHGGLALVNATPDGFAENAAMPALEGKTWNHPVLADGLLFVRNGEEMAAFRLREADG